MATEQSRSGRGLRKVGGVGAWPRSSRDLLALTVLALLGEKPRHPYEIQRLIKERRKDFVDAGPRSLYHRVDWLARRGLIEVLDVGREGRRPERTVYRITQDGREQFESWLTDLLAVPVPDHPVFNAAVGFLGHLPATTVIEALAARVVALEAEIGGIDAALRALTTELHLPRAVLLAGEHTRALRSAELAWVRSLIEDLRAGRLGQLEEADFATHLERSRPPVPPIP